MAGNSFGDVFRITTFGESHGSGIGVVVDGCPAGIAIDPEYIGYHLARRRPGQSNITTQRNEDDLPNIQSGVFEGKSTGAPIAIWIENKNQRPRDYANVKSQYRPSHADYTYDQKYGFRDYRGGGRSSARETAARVAAGSVARLLLKELNISISAYVKQIGKICIPENTKIAIDTIESNKVRCPHAATASKMEELILKTKEQGDSLGGIISCVIEGVKPGLGEPVFDRLEADLAKAMLSINATKGFEIGSGFSGSQMLGSEHNDLFDSDSTANIITKTNNSGGVQGGISNGMPIGFNVAFKPTATVSLPQQTVNQDGESVELTVTGRHDPCVVPRAVVIVESMAAIVIADHLLRNMSSNLGSLKKVYA